MAAVECLVADPGSARVISPGVVTGIIDRVAGAYRGIGAAPLPGTASYREP